MYSKCDKTDFWGYFKCPPPPPYLTHHCQNLRSAILGAPSADDLNYQTFCTRDVIQISASSRTNNSILICKMLRSILIFYCCVNNLNSLASRYVCLFTKDNIICLKLSFESDIFLNCTLQFPLGLSGVCNILH